MDLSHFQQIFQQAITQGKAIRGELDAQLISDGSKRLQIYRDNSKWGRINSLRDTYAVVNRLVGNAFFTSLAASYVKSVPSYSYDLGDDGADLADFIRGYGPGASLPYLSDVAALEWAWYICSLGADAVFLDEAVLGRQYKAEGEDIHLRLHQHSVLLHSSYPIHRIWGVNQQGYGGDDRVSLDEGGVNLLLWRPHLDVVLEPVSHEEWDLLQGFKAGLSLGEIAQGANGEKIVTLLPRFMNRGWLSAI